MPSPKRGRPSPFSPSSSSTSSTPMIQPTTPPDDYRTQTSAITTNPMNESNKIKERNPKSPTQEYFPTAFPTTLDVELTSRRRLSFEGHDTPPLVRESNSNSSGVDGSRGGVGYLMGDGKRLPIFSLNRLKKRVQMIFLNPRRKRRVFLAIFALAFYLFILRPYLSEPSSSPFIEDDTGPDPFDNYPMYNPKKAASTPPSRRRSRSRHDQTISGGSKLDGLRNIDPGHKKHLGLMVADLESEAHPITQLIAESQKQWTDKVGGQSKSLKQAAAVYQGRYGRPPPKGFDKWWHYVCDHNIVLPDEYDQINKDLYHFRALSPSKLNDKIAQTSKLPHTWTLTIQSGQTETRSNFDANIHKGGEQRVKNQLNLLKPVVKDVGDLEMVFTVHDTPQSFVSFSYKNDLIDLIEEGNYDSEDFADAEVGWSAACPSSSPAKRYNFSVLPEVPPSTEKTFISSLPSLLDLCNHPYQVPLHGVLAYKTPIARTLTPIMALSKSVLHSDILAVAPESHMDASKAVNVSWAAKTEDKLLWRGSNTGLHYEKKVPWAESHRVRLVRDFAAEGGKASKPGDEQVIILPPAKGSMGVLSKGVQKISRKEANEYYMDVGFTGSPIQCDKGDGTCDELAKNLRFNAPTVDRAKQAKFKYILDVDGNAWSSRFEQSLLTGSVIIKSTVMPEWWSDRIQPWVHYVPVQVDYSDLYDVVAYFRGDTSGQGGDDKAASAIGNAGKEWAQNHWRKEDMTAYMFRLYLEWARLVSPKRKEMDFVYDATMERERKTV